MKSSKSLFSKTVFKSNIKRFLPFSVLYAIIECIISTKIINTDVILSKLISDDFEDLILDENEQLVDYNVTCTESTGSIFFLTFKKSLIFIVFFLLF